MRVLTISELMRLTRIELCAFLARITNDLTAFPEGSAEREAAFANLRACDTRDSAEDKGDKLLIATYGKTATLRRSSQYLSAPGYNSRRYGAARPLALTRIDAAAGAGEEGRVG